MRPIATSQLPWLPVRPLRLPPNGCSITTTWSRSRSARSARTCRPATTAMLPKLAEGPLRGYPRVFGLAWAFVAHTDSRFDPEALRRFVLAYQRVQPLTIGELWAVAITLRIVLVENLRRSPQRIVSSREARAEGGRARRSPARRGRRRRSSLASPLDRCHVRRRVADRPSPCSSCSGCATRTRASHPRWRWLEERLAAQGQTRRAAGARGAPATGRRERHGAQHHHQHAADFRRRLGRILRERQPGGRGAARREHFRRDGFRDAATSTAAPSRSSPAARGSPSLRSRRSRYERRGRCKGRHGRREFVDTSGRERDPGYHLIGAGPAAFEALIELSRSVADLVCGSSMSTRARAATSRLSRC